MRGNLVSFVDGKPIFDGHITQMLAMVNMKPKFIMISGEDRPELLEKVGPVLGLTWEPQQDLLHLGLGHEDLDQHLHLTPGPWPGL